MFKEAKIYKTDNAYIIAGMINSYRGVIRAYKPEQGLTAGLCAVPIYGSEYEIRRKDSGGQWVSDKIQPTIFEKAFYDYIDLHESIWMGEGVHLTGQLSLAPNMMCEGLSSKELDELIDSNVQLEGTDPTGTLPAYTPPKTYGNRQSGGKSYGMSPDQKLEWVKKQITTDTVAVSFPNGDSLIGLIKNFVVENKDEPKAIDSYLAILEACL